MKFGKCTYYASQFDMLILETGSSSQGELNLNYIKMQINFNHCVLYNIVCVNKHLNNSV